MCLPTQTESCLSPLRVPIVITRNIILYLQFTTVFVIPVFFFKSFHSINPYWFSFFAFRITPWRYTISKLFLIWPHSHSSIFIKDLVIRFTIFQLSSAQLSRSVVPNSLQPHELQHARAPCLSPTPGAHSNSRPLSGWCHPAISSSVVPFSLLPPIPPSISLFQWVNSSHEVAKVLEFQL